MKISSPRALHVTLALAALLSAAGGLSAAQAATIVLDGSSGADYDAVGDGWFFTNPPGQPPDGVGDTGNNALAVAYQSGVVELRAMAEFPLAPLTGLAASDIQSATLTFQIDDVISTFGPGTAFDGTASDPIAVYGYPADGTVAVADFSPVGLASIEIVNVGVITDASLSTTGPIDFTVDVTDFVKDSLTNGDVAAGILFGTLDTPTGTSLDGVLPFITVETVPTEPPVLSKEEIKCQAAIGKQAGLFAKKKQGELGKCFNAVLSAVSKGDAPSTVEAKCRKGLDETDPKSVLAKARASATAAIAKSCVGITPAAIGSPCNPSAADIAAVTACVLDDHQQQVEQMVRAEYRDACTILRSVNLDEAFPDVCAP
jgi:hypothetical protein